MAFAAPLLLRRHSFVVAWAVLSAIRILWHIPLMITGQMSWTMGFVANAAYQLDVLLVVRATGGGWFLVAVWHATLNTFGGSFFTTMVSGADKERLGLLLTAAYVLLAGVALVLGHRYERAPEPAVEPLERRAGREDPPGVTQCDQGPECAHDLDVRARYRTAATTTDGP